MSPLLFYFLAGVILIPALAVVLSEKLFHAGLSLIVSFLGIAAIYVTLSAPFVAGMQVLVYAGAIDDTPSTDPADISAARNYLSAALDAALAGKPIAVATSTPYGCSVKY